MLVREVLACGSADHRLTVVRKPGNRLVPLREFLRYTSAVIALGFSIMALSNFMPTIYFGVLTGVAMILALAANLNLLRCGTRLRRSGNARLRRVSVQRFRSGVTPPQK